MTLGRLLKVLITHWPQKLAALFLAVLVWYFVNLNDTNITQRALFIPLEVEGLGESETASGVPETVSITLSGPSNQVNNLRAERLSAVLNLAGITGPYQRQIDVLVPQGMTLIEYAPREVSGTVESQSSKTVPLEISLAGSGSAGVRLSTRSATDEVIVRGLNSVLESITSALVTVPATPGEQTVTPYAVDETGNPVVDTSLEIEPARVQVTIGETPIFVARKAALEVGAPEVAPLTLDAFTVSASEVTLYGPPEALAQITSVTGQVQFATAAPEPGEYTLAVRLDLPASVAALEPITAQISLAAPPDVPDGDANDLPNPTLRRPGPTQDGQPGNLVR